MDRPVIDAERRRVVVTGVGVVTPLGSTLEKMWGNLVAGRSGVDSISLFDASSFPTRIGAEVHDLEESRGPEDPRLRSLLDRKNLFGWAAAADALRESGLLNVSEPIRVGVSIGTELRRPDFLQSLAASKLCSDPLDQLRFSPFCLASALAANFRFTGPQLTISTACTSGAQAVGVAYQKIQWGQADAMLAGGCDSLIDPLMLTGFSLLGALSKRNDAPAAASRPFDLKRDGFVLGEGAGMLVLEEQQHARARNVRIYGEILGYASSTNAYRITDSPPDGEGAYLSMKSALEDAGLRAENVDYINAHGTSTLQNDRSETIAIKRCLEKVAYDVPVSSTKSMMGHLVNGGGAVEAIICLLTLVHGVLPPTINQETPDPECDLDYVPNVARDKKVQVALSNSFGFGGVNATLVLGKVGNA